MTAVAGTARGPLAGRFETPSLFGRVARFTLTGPSEAAVIAGASLGLYLAVGALLVFVFKSIEGDAWSRVGSAYYMLYSRDPHLAAIGFVWNPLPSLAVLPLLPFKGLWPALVEQGFAGNIVSALCMAGAVYQVRASLREMGVSRAASVILTVLFALHPMIVLYGANGMSEAMFLFFALTAVRYLTRWVRVQESPALVHAGIALALLYLTRYEAIAVAAGAVFVVVIVSYVRGRADRRQGGTTAIADALILVVPFASAVALWALASWIIVGDPFESFSSVYGYTSQLKFLAEDIQAATGQGTTAAVDYAARQILGIAPVVAMVGAGFILALVRRSPHALVPIVLLGASLSFSIWAFLTGRSYGNLRYYIVVLPLVTLAAGAMLARVHSASYGMAQLRRSANLLITGTTLALVALGLPSGLATMDDSKLGRGTSDKVSLFLGSADARLPTDSWQGEHSAARELAGYLDGLALSPGSVLVDVAFGFPVVLQSRQPDVFVITPDRDFPAVIADPAAFGVRYLMVPPAFGYGQADAIERSHPGMYDTGAGMADLVKQFGSGDVSSTWRLYQVRGGP
jgi:4-amino-4-deoxy-L-arabinose transferase-like glycosyltransferase